MTAQTEGGGGIHPDILDALGVAKRAERAMALLAIIAGDHPFAVSCDDPRFEAFTDDFFDCDTFNLLFEMCWIDQLGSGQLDDFRIVLLPKGAQAIETQRAKTEGLRAQPASVIPTGDAPDPHPERERKISREGAEDEVCGAGEVR